ncbi:MAG: hypothetical protein ACLFP2_01825 [Candidatus Woesearchaeota archaeon]
MRYKILIVAFMVIFTAGCTLEDLDKLKYMGTQENKNQDVRIINFETEKYAYGSHENLKATVKIESAIKAGGKARLIGIKPHTYHHIDNTKRLDLNKGENKIVFNVKTPHCTSGCGGVYPGPYDITIQLSLNDTVVAESTKTIELVS